MTDSSIWGWGWGCVCFFGFRREVWDLSSLSFPRYILYNSWKNSHCKTPLDRTLVFVYHCCWAATGVYAGVEVREEGGCLVGSRR